MTNHILQTMMEAAKKSSLNGLAIANLTPANVLPHTPSSTEADVQKVIDIVKDIANGQGLNPDQVAWLNAGRNIAPWPEPAWNFLANMVEEKLNAAAPATPAGMFGTPSAPTPAPALPVGTPDSEPDEVFDTVDWWIIRTTRSINAGLPADSPRFFVDDRTAEKVHRTARGMFKGGKNLDDIAKMVTEQVHESAGYLNVRAKLLAHLKGIGWTAERDQSTTNPATKVVGSEDFGAMLAWLQRDEKRTPAQAVQMAGILAAPAAPVAPPPPTAPAGPAGMFGPQ